MGDEGGHAVILLSVMLVAACFAALTFGLLYRAPAFEATRRSQDASDTALPDFLQRTVGNLTGWRFVTQSKFKSAKMSKMLDQTDNPWRVTQTQFYALMTLAGIAGAGLGAVIGAFSYASFFMGTISEPVIGVPLFMVLGGVAGFGTGWTIPYAMLKQQFSKHQQGFVSSLGDLEDLFATASASGKTLEQSMRVSYDYLPDGATRIEMGRLIDDMNRGFSLPEAVEGMMERIPDRHVRVFGMLLIDLYVNGSSPTEALRREAAEMRAEQTREIKERANKVQGFMVALVMGLAIPAVLLAFVPGAWPMISEGLSNFLGGTGEGIG